MPISPAALRFLPPIAARTLRAEEERRKGGRPGPRFPALPPGRERQLLEELGRKSLGALEVIGRTLDIPGHAIRKTLARIAPGPVGEDVSGRALLERAGLVGPNIPGFGQGFKDLPADVAGFVTEVALDPLSYITLGGSAVTKAGKVARAVGKLPRGAGGRLARYEARLSKILPELTTGQREVAEQAAKKFGGLEGLMEMPLGGPVGLGIPFRDPFAVYTGRGAAGLARKLDVPGKAFRWSRLGRWGARMFEPSVRYTSLQPSQIKARGMTAAMEETTAKARTQAAGMYQGLKDMGIVTDTQFMRALRAAREKTWVGAPEDITKRTYQEAVEKNFPKLTPDQRGGILGVVEEMDETTRDYILSELASGHIAKELADDSIEYAHRRGKQMVIKEGALPSARIAGKVFPITHPAAMKRKDFLREIYPSGAHAGGTSSLDDLAMDRRISGPYRNLEKLSLGQMTPTERGFKETTTLAEATTIVWYEYLNKTSSDWAKLSRLNGMLKEGTILSDVDSATRSALDAVKTQARRLSRYAARLNPRHAEEGIGMFEEDVFKDHLIRGLFNAQVVASGDAITGLFAETAERAALAGGRSAYGVMRKIKLRGEMAPVRFAEELAKRGKVAENFPRRIAEGDKKALKVLESFQIPGEIGKDAVRMMSVMRATQEVSPMIQIADRMTNLFKAGVTIPFVAFHVRNLNTGIWQNFVVGASDPRYKGLRSWWEPWKDAYRMMRGDAIIPDASKMPHFAGRKLTDEAATRELRSLIYGHRVWEPRATYRTEQLVAGADEVSPEDIASEIVGQTPLTPRQIVSELAPAVHPIRAVRKALEEGRWFPPEYNPFEVRGVGTIFGKREPPSVSRNFLVRTGEQAASFTEGLNRITPFIAKMRQGWAPDAAAALSRSAHVDYSQLTDFERKFMRRTIPFMTFSRHMIPFQLREMWERPGGMVSQYIRAVRVARERQYVPPDIAAGLAVPIGEPVGGRQEFLTGFDLPPEQISEFIALRGDALGNIEETGRRLLAQMNPLIKGPLELAVGQQFYTGRELSQISPRSGLLPRRFPGTEMDIPGRTIMDQILYNLPFSRFITTAQRAGRAVTGKRARIPTALQLATGMKFRAPMIEAVRQAGAREQIERLLRRGGAVRGFETIAVEPGAVLTAEEQEYLRLYYGIGRQRRLRAIRRRAEAPR